MSNPASLKSSFAVVQLLLQLVAVVTCVHYFHPRENVGFPFVLFRFIMYIAEFYLQFVLFSSLLSLCVCLNNEKIHKIVQVWVCVSAAAARQRQFRFPVESLPALFSHSTNPKRNENQKYCHWFCLIGSCIGLFRCYRKVIVSTFHLWRISFFCSLECWFYWFSLYKMIFSQNVQIHFSRAD